MDTGSHLLFGATLAGLAFLDPAVSGHPDLAHALLASTMIGSHAPDFDTVVRLKSYSHYIRYHRGITHSLPALFIWPALISLPIAALFGVMGSWSILYFWTLLAVIFHVFLDWLNAYGVQCFRPFDKRWRHLDVLPLFDPFLFGMHLVGVIVWLWRGWPPGPLFSAVYLLTFLYIGFRILVHRTVILRVKEQLKQAKAAIMLVPGLLWFKWQFILETDHEFRTGTISGQSIQLWDEYRKDREHPAVRATLEAEGVKAFLHLAERVHVSITEKQDGFLVEWREVRFWHNSKLPFGVDVRVDGNLRVRREQLYWSKKVWEPPYV
ncbi:MAG: metal-dependent hydrolase [Paenibacillaceae bacterium]|jgi:inner membrane protein|nr:metal-dependent hydrolase [Paenibacillaceae bacterium]